MTNELAKAGSESISPDRLASIPVGQRWIPDAFEVSPAAGGLLYRLADMTQAKRAIEILRKGGIKGTYSHVLMRAAALALARCPDAHVLSSGYRRMNPGAVDLGVSMKGETSYAPVVILHQADRKTLGELIVTANAGFEAGRIKEKVDLDNMRRQAWVIPFGWLRRWFLRRVVDAFWFKRKLVGTFQISILPNVDIVIPMLFFTGAILAAGAVTDRVLAENGQPVVRPSVWITIAFNHTVLDGYRSGVLLTTMKTILESDELVREAEAAVQALPANAAANGASA